MIDRESKSFALSGDIPVGGPTTWHIVDWDQRRVVSMAMNGEQDEESLAIEQHFSCHSDQLSHAVYRVYISYNGEMLLNYTDLKND
jgi:hypothetical protein